MKEKVDEHYRWRALPARLSLFGIGILFFIQLFRTFESQFFGPWLIAFIFIVVGIIAFEMILARRYRCPSCNSLLMKPNVDHDRSDEYYHDCKKCDTRWFTKTVVPRDG